jgi:putative membrane protein
MIRDYLSGFPAFMAHFALAACFLALFAAIYTRITRHNEFELMRGGNMAAAVALAGSLIGFSFPLAATVEYSASILDNALWATVSLVVQIGIYFIARIFLDDLSGRIERGEISAGIWLGAVSVAGGQLVAASMTT